MLWILSPCKAEKNRLFEKYGTQTRISACKIKTAQIKSCQWQVFMRKAMKHNEFKWQRRMNWCWNWLLFLVTYLLSLKLAGLLGINPLSSRTSTPCGRERTNFMPFVAQIPTTQSTKNAPFGAFFYWLETTCNPRASYYWLQSNIFFTISYLFNTGRYFRDFCWKKKIAKLSYDHYAIWR